MQGDTGDTGRFDSWFGKIPDGNGHLLNILSEKFQGQRRMVTVQRATERATTEHAYTHHDH